jgi:hypothetical protein
VGKIIYFLFSFPFHPSLLLMCRARQSRRYTSHCVTWRRTSTVQLCCQLCARRRTCAVSKPVAEEKEGARATAASEALGKSEFDERSFLELLIVSSAPQRPQRSALSPGLTLVYDRRTRCASLDSK